MRGMNLVLLRQHKPSHLSHDFGLLTVRVVLSELGHTREMLDNGWI